LQPDADTLLSFSAPQPFVPLYALVLGKGGHIFMNVVCIIGLWFVSSLVNIYHMRDKIPNKNLEYRDRYRRRFSPCIRRSPRWSPSVFKLGLADSKWSAPQCCSGSMGRGCSRDMHSSPLVCCLHFFDFGLRCALSRGLWTDLLWALLSYPEELSETQMEPGEVEQTFSIHWDILEWLGCCYFILTL